MVAYIDKNKEINNMNFNTYRVQINSFPFQIFSKQEKNICPLDKKSVLFLSRCIRVYDDEAKTNCYTNANKN